MVLYAAGLAIVAFLAPTVAIAGLAATIALVTVGEMLTMPIVPSLVSDLSPVQRRGWYQGIALAAVGLGSAVGPPVAGWVLDTTAGDGLWLGAAAVLLVVALALVGLARMTDGIPPLEPELAIAA
jgi:MFS family permease